MVPTFVLLWNDLYSILNFSSDYTRRKDKMNYWIEVKKTWTDNKKKYSFSAIIAQDFVKKYCIAEYRSSGLGRQHSKNSI